MRMLTTFAPLVAAWCLVAPHLGVFDLSRVGEPLQLWRPFWAMILATPLAAWLRGLWLETAIEVSFVAVLALTSALGILIWRAIYALWIKQKSKSRDEKIYG